MAFTLSADQEKTVDELMGRYPTKRAACLPLLHICQRQEGWISPEVIAYVAKRLDMETSEVKGVVTFYTLYQQKPVGEHVVWVCRTLSCELRGAKSIQEHVEKRIGCKVGETSADGKFTLQKAECLAACGQGPMLQIDDDYYENLDCVQVDEILARLRG